MTTTYLRLFATVTIGTYVAVVAACAFGPLL